MSLKRKANFSTTSVNPFANPFASCDVDMEDSSKHLNSRTRKRFRDGRPNDEVVYEKTLRWIFSAQQQQGSGQMDTSEEIMEEASSLPTPETVDPRQQTLLRFFQPRTQQGPSFKPSREALVPRANDIAMNEEDALRLATFEQMKAGNSCGSEAMSNVVNPVDMDMDMDMDMDTDESSDSSNPTSNMGTVGWM